MFHRTWSGDIYGGHAVHPSRRTRHLFYLSMRREAQSSYTKNFQKYLTPPFVLPFVAVLGKNGDERSFFTCLESGGIVVIDDSTAGKNGSQIIWIQGNREVLPMEHVFVSISYLNPALL